jgi:3-dehydroquinate dehydratase II
MPRRKRKPVYVVNGPNLNLLGRRETLVYGTTTLPAIERALARKGKKLGLKVVCRQSNHEGTLVDWIQEAEAKAAALLVNPGGYSHTSVAIRDALAALSIPAIEVHLTNIHAREKFRRSSRMSAVVSAVVTGLGPKGYELALEAVAEMLT